LCGRLSSSYVIILILSVNVPENNYPGPLKSLTSLETWKLIKLCEELSLKIILLIIETCIFEYITGKVKLKSSRLGMMKIELYEDRPGHLDKHLIRY
jgi:hypothetical protein